ncbi:DUF1896 family protein [Sphingobacterium sp. B29]|uniref:DUF1896 family protein n=1 Tax=Sphingobacterium sp. B29 TaxID=1933220 RepID=UPI0026D8B28C
MDKEISYFKLRLQERLENSFPKFANDKDFIDQRSKWAKNAFGVAFQAGNPVEECEQYADYILFENLYFSKFDTMYNVVIDEFGSLMMNEELHPFALKMQKDVIPYLTIISSVMILPILMIMTNSVGKLKPLLHFGLKNMDFNMTVEVLKSSTIPDYSIFCVRDNSGNPFWNEVTKRS